MEENTADFANLGDNVGQWLDFYYVLLCNLRGKGHNHRRRPGDEVNFDTFDELDYTMKNVVSYLQFYNKIVDPEGFSSHDGKYDCHVDFYTGTNEEKWMQDQAAFLEVAPEFNHISRYNADPFPGRSHLPVKDELGRGLDHLLWRGSMPFWLPVNEVLAFDAYVNDTIQQYPEFHASTSIVGSDSTKFLQDIQLDATFWKDDPITTLKHMMGAGARVKDKLFLELNPLYCGLWVHDMRTRLHHAGVLFNADWSGVLYMGHLYNAFTTDALTSSRVADREWHDMELMYRMQGGKEKFFIGEPPTDPTGYFRPICMAMGFREGNWAPSRRNKGKLVASKTGSRALQQQGKVSMLFHCKMGPQSFDFSLAAEDVQNILIEGKKKTALPKLGIKWASPSELVRSLASTIDAEVPEITVDYFLMHRICWAQLRKLNSAVNQDMCNWIGPNWMDGDYQLPFVVGYIFREAAGEEGRAPSKSLLLKAVAEFLAWGCELGQ
ncbi:hypothetical protein B0T22DRAFT_487077 [Podospora appendiculata]|uniref:Uncharacterized protein n=1 Tax=Podospora appendiculata TaxID=314037 RepID=A0AAE0XHJ7_9PEZI|nr:hypothetical protein B0T22DRAFT_487077 [Podospora appendiculata]